MSDPSLVHAVDRLMGEYSHSLPRDALAAQNSLREELAMALAAHPASVNTASFHALITAITGDYLPPSSVNCDEGTLLDAQSAALIEMREALVAAVGRAPALMSQDRAAVLAVQPSGEVNRPRHRP